MAVSEIRDFYSDRSVFITGVSGFLGKAILEKLLRSCPEVSKVYVLIRVKFGIDVDTRLKTILHSPIFETLKRESPSALSKVIAVAGDISVHNLGISEIDREEICKNVSIVIHSAASIKFNEPIRAAINNNYNGTRRILDLCHDMASLSALVHVSTAYANCDLSEISERILTPKNRPFTPQEIEAMSDEEALEVTPMIIGEKPNTYSYAKGEAENLLQEHGAKLPICIIRPSIIGAAWKEPQPGFVDSLNGMTGLIAATGKGMLTSMVCGTDKITDVIPLDATVNLILSTAWKTATQRPSEIPVYNCCSGTINPITHGGVRDRVFETLEIYPFNGVIRYPYLQYVTSPILNSFLNLWFNFLPFLLLDAIAVLSKRKPRMVKIFNKTIAVVSSMTYFHMNQWKFETENMGKLAKSMGPLDKELFYWNIEEMDWDDYLKDYCLGIKKWIFKENMKDLPKAKARMKMMYWIRKLVEFVFLLVSGILFLRMLL